jgi:hypothetical protein
MDVVEWVGVTWWSDLCSQSSISLSWGVYFLLSRKLCLMDTFAAVFYSPAPLAHYCGPSEFGRGSKLTEDACEFCSRLVDHSALIMLVVGMLVSCGIGLWNGTTRGWNCLLYFSSTLLQLNNWCSVSYVSFSVQVSFLDDDDVLMLAALYHHYGVLFRRCWTQSLINVNVFIDIPLVIERKRTAKWLASYKSNAVRNHESILSYFLPCLVFQY